MGERIDAIDSDQPLALCQDKNAAVRWPLPIDYRLDQLVARAAEVGEKTSRKELLAALVLGATEDPAEISTLVRSLRVASAGEAIVRDDIERDGNVLKFPRYRPGPR